MVTDTTGLVVAVTRVVVMVGMSVGPVCIVIRQFPIVGTGGAIRLLVFARV